MPRTVDEWRGRTDDSMPPDRVKDRIRDRQDNICALSGVELAPGIKVQYDHIVPLWLGGENVESNLQAVTEAAHKQKTKTEASVRAKCNRTRKKHRGITKPKSSLLQRENEEMKSELAHEASHRQKLQNALAYWMPGVTEEIEISTNGRCGDDALLLVGSEGPFEDKCWGNQAIARAEAAEAEVKRLEAELALSKPVYSRRQLEDRVKTLEKALKPFADVAQYYDPPEKDENQKLWCIATMPTIGNVRDARTALASTGGEHNADK